MKQYPITVFLPVYNFTPSRLVSNVAVVENYLKQNYPQYEMIIVDDNSNEATRAAMKTLVSPTLSVLNYDFGPSRRENLAASFCKAKYEYLCYMDVDLATDLNCLPPLTDSLEQGYEIAIGSRYKGIQPVRNRQRYWISNTYRLVLKILFSTKVLDHTCGFKAFRKSVVVPIVNEMGFDRTLRRGWFWDAEMLIRAQDAGHTINEIAVPWKADNESTFNIKRELKLLPCLAGLWFKRLFRKRNRKCCN
ncbi:MAG: glycosyltransferase [Fibrobacteres bacterium]|nr:glycosyltransferase [Fibrobacterota bacterium]